jgi:hypothetical protein
MPISIYAYAYLTSKCIAGGFVHSVSEKEQIQAIQNDTEWPYVHIDMR